MPVDLQALYPRLIHLMLDTVFVVDRDNQIVFVSDACEALLGYRACELIGTPITDYMHPDDLAITRASIVRVMNGQPHYDFCNRYLRKDGSVVHILWAACWSEEAQARIGVARDVTAQRKAEDELRFLAHHDPLTRLANRAMFNERLDTALAAARRHNRRLALLFLDINDFKQINDTQGHARGDTVLVEFAAFLRSPLGAAENVVRMGGDEFMVLLPGRDERGAATVVEQIGKVVELNNQFYPGTRLSFSIGHATCQQGERLADIVKLADSRMYQAKRDHYAALADERRRD